MSNNHKLTIIINIINNNYLKETFLIFHLSLIYLIKIKFNKVNKSKIKY
jgi:hypothetical protein